MFQSLNLCPNFKKNQPKIFMGLYNNYIMPRLCDYFCSTKPIQYQRKKIVCNATGIVLEIGMGSGNNIPFYNYSKVEKIIGLDPSEELSIMAKKNAKKYNADIEHISGYAEDIHIEDNKIDTVLMTYTLCSIDDTEKALKEIHRVLKPSGQFLFCEHGTAPDKDVSKWQNRMNPFWKRLAGGCNLNKNIPELDSVLSNYQEDIGISPSSIVQ